MNGILVYLVSLLVVNIALFSLLVSTTKEFKHSFEAIVMLIGAVGIYACIAMLAITADQMVQGKDVLKSFLNWENYVVMGIDILMVTNIIKNKIEN